MADRDDKGRRHPRLQTQTQRDDAGLRARAEREAKRAAKRDQVDELADAVGDDGGVPREVDFEGEVTKPTDIDEFGPLEPMSRREAQLWDRVNRLKLEVRRTRHDTVDRITDAMGKRPPNERFTRLETRVKIIWAILIFVGTTALGAAITVAKGLYERGSTDGAHEVRLQQVEHTTERNAARLDRIERELGADHFASPPAKGSTPP